MYTPPPAHKRVIKIAAVVLWLFAVVAGYFWAHKPFSPKVVTGLGRSLFSIAGWLGITWLGTALGRRAAGELLDDERPVTRLALSAGLGLGLISLLVLGLGLVGLLRPIAAWGLVLTLGVLLWPSLWASLVDLRAIRLPQPRNTFQRWLAIYGGISLLLTFLTALTPPTGWDTLVYHLTGPRFFAEAGRIVHPIDLPYLGFPQLGEMQFTLGLLLVGERVAPLLHFGYGVLALAITASLARRTFGEDVAWLATALLLSVPTLLSLMTRAYVDATLLFYATAALYTFVRWREPRAAEHQTGDRKWLLMMGLLCGFCGGVKYTAVAIPAALGLSLIWVSRRDGLWKIVERLASVAIVAIAVALPWTLENWLTTDNPVYPFLFSQGVYWDEWRSWWYDRSGTGLASTAPWRLLILPLEATILGTEGTRLYEATIGPLLLTSPMLLIFIWRSLHREERAVIKHMLLFFGVNYILWLNGVARTALLLRTRFLFLAFGAAAVLGSVALEWLSTLRLPRLALDWLARAVVSLTLALLLFSTATEFVRHNPLPVTLGLESRRDYLIRRLGWYYAAVEHVNQKLPEDSIILFLWETRSYHCTVDCRPDALLDRWLHTIHIHGHDADAIAEAWRSDGITHVLIHRTGLEHVLSEKLDPVTPEDLDVLDELETEHLIPMEAFGEVYDLYRLEREP